MKEQIYQKLIELTNGKSTSQVLRAFAQSKVSQYLINGYTKVYDINLQEVSKNRQQFSSLHDFFIRELKREARPIANTHNVLVSPVDAKIEAFGDITPNQTFIVKGKPYQLVDLLGQQKRADDYQDGQYIVFYLSPADYHRMHSPVDAKVMRQYVLGNGSYPVNQVGLTYGKKPLSHNYRMITQLKNDNITCEFIKVGATFVNSIVLTNTTDTWHKGEEVGYFSFGSTVIMLFKKAEIQFTENVVPSAKIKMGEAFATML
ncbi:phosphatidylserine decarboxylase proenzyme [Lysinibacillus alkalisoli]|uniref:phosphatidylserine decarboxylase n=1 Tax=Lysinibacillus alkalisoli TaxID=1911548 RepID=A0A917LIJ0_9BACI|nr:phosphatidylserine decarboxylase [Lysinibacillus alkalisoli]GGG27039.1 phosphatidylserine decarboxylase proenzyme [Lysinibacillus alkalisoli]